MPRRSEIREIQLRSGSGPTPSLAPLRRSRETPRRGGREGWPEQTDRNGDFIVFFYGDLMVFFSRVWLFDTVCYGIDGPLT